jgi:hypothetical protein
VRAWLFALLCACSSKSEPAQQQPVVDAAPTPMKCERIAKSVPPATCNGSTALCDRSFDKVSVVMTHNAMSNAEDKFAAPNQNKTVANQLQMGVRGLMLDTHYYDVDSGQTDARVDGVDVNEQAYLCHGNCALGRRKLFDTLCDITQFLDKNRGEVVSIIFESGVNDADTVEVMKRVGLTDYVYTHGGAWPTLKEMIAKDTRLVVFTESGGGSPGWYHPAWSLVFDTPYTFAKQEEFSCALNRGKRSNPLFLLNHWIGDPLANPARAAEVNVESVLLTRANKCAMEAGKPPNFVGVDFFDIGDALKVAASLSAR